MPVGEEKHLAFEVDTSIVRQLGALLVGRDSTAVVELLKNSYDADATKVVVNSDTLTSGGSLAIADDGTGMTETVFESSFLRIGGGSKRTGEPYSKKFKRRFTGAKGIGRLSAHKLSQQLIVESESGGKSFRAAVDWNEIENSDQSIEKTSVVVVNGTAPSDVNGTILRLVDLRSEWTQQQVVEFLSELRSARPDESLMSEPPAFLSVDALFPSIKATDTSASDPGMEVEFTGALSGGDSAFPELLAHVNWMIELGIVGNLVKCRISPTQLTKARLDVEAQDFEWPAEAGAPSISARIFVRDEQASRDRLPPALSRFAKETSGIRVFLEGFRVLPYGAPGDDWLSISRDATRRTALSAIEFEVPTPKGIDVRIYQLATSNYFGGVFLTERDAPGLEMVVNREGFLPSVSFVSIQNTVRRAIDLSVRVRAAAGAVERVEARRVAKGERASGATPVLREDEDRALRTVVAKATELVGNARASGGGALPSEAMKEVEHALAQVTTRLAGAAEEEQQLRILSSLGSQAAAFVHEVGSLLAQARGVEKSLQRILESEELSPAIRRRLAQVLKAQSNLVAGFAQQAVYLTDTMGADARRRRSPQNVSTRLDSAMRLLLGAASDREIEIRKAIEPDLTTGPMYASELSVVLSNLLSNAIKAASDLKPGQILVSGVAQSSGVSITVENTGRQVDLASSERWFRPFESTTSKVDDVLGQGLGLGLTLSRRIVEDYGGTVRFVEPSPGFATAVNVVLPRR
jgi:signal transduction histidine kinase